MFFPLLHSDYNITILKTFFFLSFLPLPMLTAFCPMALNLAIQATLLQFCYMPLRYTSKLMLSAGGVHNSNLDFPSPRLATMQTDFVSIVTNLYRWPLHGSTYLWVLKINIINIFSFPYDFLNKFLFSLASKTIEYNTYNTRYELITYAISQASG